MKYMVSGYAVIKFNDIIKLSDGEVKEHIDAGDFEDFLKCYFRDHIDFSIIPDGELTVGDVNVNDMKYTTIKE